MEDFIRHIPQIWIDNLRVDVQRYVIFAVAVWLTLWVVLRGVLMARKIRREVPPARQLVLEFLFSVRSVAIFSSVGLVIGLMQQVHLYALEPTAERWGPVWFWISLVLMIMGQDGYIYWVHRWMHRPRWFRAFHRRHHKSNNPSPFTAYSFDPGEAVLMVLFVLAWPLVVPTPWPVVSLVMFHQIFRNTMLHSGYELTPARRDGRPWFDFLTTTTHHDLHHAQAGYNFAPWFTWWDRWLGTEHPQYHARFADAAWRPLAGRRTPTPQEA